MVQFGSHPLHSTEKALFKLASDDLMAADSGMLTILIFFDLGAALDTTCHTSSSTGYLPLASPTVRLVPFDLYSVHSTLVL